MNERFILDTETNGIDRPTKVHCLGLKNIDTGEVLRFRKEGIAGGLSIASASSLLIGHNIIDYDLVVLRDLYGFEYSGQVYDTLTAAKVIHPRKKLTDDDFRRKDIPDDVKPKIAGRHSLKAWGIRLGLHKGDFGEQGDDTVWDEWSQEMEDYMEQDLHVTHKLFDHLQSSNPDPRMLEVEFNVARIIGMMQRRGFNFDKQGCIKLYAELAALREKDRKELQAIFPPWERIEKEFIAKVTRKDLGYAKGDKVVKRKTIEFNPGSNDHIAQKLTELYGWKPTEFTEKGKPKVDEEVLAALKYKEAPLLAHYKMVEKRIGMIAEGAEAYLNNLKEDGKLHGKVDTNGAITGRMTHSRPNMANPPSLRVPYGKEIRGLLIPSPGYVLVGADADALELRCLGSYMYRWDGGEYIKTILSGDKAAGTDMHSVNCRALGKDPKELTGNGKETWRDVAKTFFYAFIYGAQGFKLGTIMRVKGKQGQVVAAGDHYKQALLKGVPALGALTNAVQSTLKERGYLIGLDGRKLYVKSPHAALNSVLQSAGGIIMKTALWKSDEMLTKEGLGPKEYGHVANVHDEFQAEAFPELADKVGSTFVKGMEAAGEHWGLKCPITGNYVIGNSWAETH